MVSDERIRALCDRVVRSTGEEFQSALMELEKAIELLLDSGHRGKQAPPEG